MAKPFEKLGRDLRKVQSLLAEGRAPEALAITQRLVDLHNHVAAVHFNHAVVALACMRPADAIEHARRAFTLDNSLTQVLKVLARSYLLLEEPFEALKYADQFRSLLPGDPEALMLSGISLQKLKYAHEAIERLECAVAASVTNAELTAEIHHCLAQALADVEGRVDDGESHARRAVELSPSASQYRMGLANILTLKNETAEAVEQLKFCLAMNPLSGSAYWNRVRIKKITANDSALIDEMQKIYKSKDTAPMDRIVLGYALAKSLDDLGDYTGAVDCWDTAGALQKKWRGFDIQIKKLAFARYYAQFPSKPPPRMSPFQYDGLTPIFIVGMPRSGTTLIEQIIGAHSAVTPLGELEYLSRAVQLALDHQGNLSSPVALSNIRNQYLASIARHGIATPFFTDKMPLNFRFVPLIAHAFPEAEIIHVRRDARAICFSNFSTYFPAKGLTYSCDQEDVVEYYKLYHDWMEYVAVPFRDRIHQLQYETMTEEQEAETRRLLNSCGLQFETACLDFHKSDRAISTASQRQVKQGMYKGSSERWRRYEPWLARMMAALNRHGL